MNKLLFILILGSVILAKPTFKGNLKITIGLDEPSVFYSFEAGPVISISEDLRLQPILGTTLFKFNYVQMQILADPERGILINDKLIQFEFGIGKVFFDNKTHTKLSGAISADPLRKLSDVLLMLNYEYVNWNNSIWKNSIYSKHNIGGSFLMIRKKCVDACR